MTEQELDKIIRLIPTASDRQAEIIAGQIDVHLKLNEKRHPPKPPLSPFIEEDGYLSPLNLACELHRDGKPR